MKKQTLLNYNILIEEDEHTGTDEKCYAVYCPTLSLADWGDTIEEAAENMKKMIEFHLECLVAEGEEIPEETNKRSFFSNIQVLKPQSI